MTLYYVTGLSGAGKCAVLDEVRARGYHARGVDEDGYADWINRITGRRDAFPRDDPGFDFHAWYAARYWVLSVRRISVLSRARARSRTAPRQLIVAVPGAPRGLAGLSWSRGRDGPWA